mmetsp:Transcript_10269/g.31402  ORF Transcript_10269/g.31402 Transcript_10269/m.31402 type:complete len:305 (+) Transcript_10269:71-985(+)
MALLRSIDAFFFFIEEKCYTLVFLSCLKRPVSKYAVFPILLGVFDLGVLVGAAAGVFFVGSNFGVMYIAMFLLRVLDLLLTLLHCRIWRRWSVLQLLLGTIVLFANYPQVEGGSNVFFVRIVIIASFVACFELFVLVMQVYKMASQQQAFSADITFLRNLVRAEPTANDMTCDEMYAWRDATDFGLVFDPSTDELFVTVPEGAAVLKWFWRKDSERVFAEENLAALELMETRSIHSLHTDASEHRSRVHSHFTEVSEQRVRVQHDVESGLGTSFLGASLHNSSFYTCPPVGSSYRTSREDVKSR